MKNTRFAGMVSQGYHLATTREVMEINPIYCKRAKRMVRRLLVKFFFFDRLQFWQEIIVSRGEESLFCQLVNSIYADSGVMYLGAVDLSNLKNVELMVLIEHVEVDGYVVPTIAEINVAAHIDCLRMMELEEHSVFGVNDEHDDFDVVAE